MLEFVARAILGGIIGGGCFVFGWYRGRDALKREQFQAARDHRIKHEREHGA